MERATKAAVAPHINGPWESHAAIHGQEGVAFVIYPADTSEPLAEVLARDGAEHIARRMAAAPELLEALELLVVLNLDDDETTRRAVAKARAAIAKATGAAS
jgi:hypothetical protein